MCTHMTRSILKFTLAGMLLLGAPVAIQASNMIEIVENDFQNVTISVSESTVHVTNASGQMLYVYNVAGVRVMSVKIEGADKKIDLNLPKGCYILKVGKTVRKISIK